MREFDFKGIPKTLLTPDIVAMLTGIHEHKGKQELYIEAHADGDCENTKHGSVQPY